MSESPFQHHRINLREQRILCVCHKNPDSTATAWNLLLTANGAGVPIRRKIRLLDITEVCLYGGLASYPFLYICSTVNWADLCSSASPTDFNISGLGNLICRSITLQTIDASCCCNKMGMTSRIIAGFPNHRAGKLATRLTKYFMR